VYTEVYIYG